MSYYDHQSHICKENELEGFEWSDKWARKTAIGIACGLVHLHRHDIYYTGSMALRADNVLLDDDWSPKLKGYVDCEPLTRSGTNDSVY